jgi:hypothetical protein
MSPLPLRIIIIVHQGWFDPRLWYFLEGYISKALDPQEKP